MKKFVNMCVLLYMALCSTVPIHANDSEIETQTVNVVFKCYSKSSKISGIPKVTLYTAQDTTRMSPSRCYNTNDSTLTLFKLKVGTEFLLHYPIDIQETTEEQNHIEYLGAFGRKVTGISGKELETIPVGGNWMRIVIPASVNNGVYYNAEPIIFK